MARMKEAAPMREAPAMKHAAASAATHEKHYGGGTTWGQSIRETVSDWVSAGTTKLLRKAVDDAK